MITETTKAKNKSRQGLPLRWTLFIIGAPFFLLFFGKMLWGPIGVNFHYSSGERTIRIVKIAEKGLVWKTWEFEGIIAPGAGTYVWDFSVDNANPRKEELIKKLYDAFQTGKIIKIKYDQRAGSVPWRSETSYFVEEVLY